MNSKRRLFLGWDDNIAGMRPGGIRQLIVPPHLGFGAQDHGNIPGGTLLIIGESSLKKPQEIDPDHNLDFTVVTVNGRGGLTKA